MSFGSLRAHDPGLSTARVAIHNDAIAVEVTFSGSDLSALRPPPFEGVSGNVATGSREGEWIARLFELRAGQSVVAPGAIRLSAAPGGELEFRLLFARPPAGGTLTLRALRLGELPPGHRQFVTVTDEAAAVIAERLLTAKEPDVTFALRPSRPGSAEVVQSEAMEDASAPSPFGSFLRLGIEHIWTGYDHLLFLFGLLVVCPQFRSIVAIVTCFTLAHSLTLGLATLDIVNVPSRVVEPLIAASIVFVGVENLLRRGAEPKGRWVLTFGFGLIHGFGFAGVLRELGIGNDGRGIGLPLVSFNLGVEVGQIAVAAVVLPLVWRLRKNDGFLRFGVPALSAAVAAAGVYWLLERTLFA